MKTKLSALGASCIVFLLAIAFTGNQPLGGAGFSQTDQELIGLLTEHGFTGRIEEQLENKLGRKLDPKKVELGKLIFFDNGLAWHQDNSCAGCHAPSAGFGDSQFMAIGVESNNVIGEKRKGPRNQRRSPMVANTGFYPALMWNNRFASNSNDPFDNTKGFTFPAPEADTFFRANDKNINHLLVAQAHMPFTELPEMAGFRNTPAEFNMSRFQGLLLSIQPGVTKKALSTKRLFVNSKHPSYTGDKTGGKPCEPYDVALFSDDDSGFPLPPFENSFVNFPIRKKTLELINQMPEYRRLFSEIYPQVRTKGIEFFMIGQAIAEFELFLTFAKAPLDQFAMGHYKAMTEDQKQGAILFFKKANCVSCHRVSGNSNEMFSDFALHNAGVPQVTPTFGPKTGNVGFATLEATLCKNGIYDLGRFEFDGLATSKFMFRTSPLRNVALQPAFFHNGAFNNLREAIVFHLDPLAGIKTYNPHKNGISTHATYYEEATRIILASLDPALKGGAKLTSKEIDQLTAFLSVGLLDPDAKPENLNKLIPTALPSGMPVAQFASERNQATAARVGLSSEPDSDEEAELWIRVYPNPFVDRTTVEYQVAVASQVRYTLLDANGRVVARKVVDQPEGRHQIHVDGRVLPAGQYLCQLQVGQKSRTVRLIKNE